MKRSTTVQLTLLSSVAALLIGCRSQQARNCVDDGQKVVDDWNCREAESSSYHGGYHWYYGGGYGRMPIGTRMSGGSSGSSTSSSGTAHGVVGSAGEAASGHSSGAHSGGAGE